MKTEANNVLPIEKNCTKCGVVKPLAQFYKSQKSRYGITEQCKDCRNATIEKHYSTLSEEEKKRRRSPYLNGDYCRSANFKKCYGLSLDDVKKMHEAQFGLCANRGCGIPINVEKRGVFKGKGCVDHCHTTGKVRGLLCFKCNTTLGLLEDKNVVLGLVEYLQKYDQKLAFDKGK